MNNYFFIDGSALLQQIKYLQQQRAEFKGKKLNILTFAYGFLRGAATELHQGKCKRFVFYFVKDEDRVESYLDLPNFTVPDLIGFAPDIAIKYCGKSLRSLSKKQKEFLDNIADDEIRELCTKKEKGVDIQICSDALKLAATGKMDRLFLLTNDSDFVPLCEALKDLGTNVSLFHLSKVNQLNRELREACDNYLALRDNEIEHVFGPGPFG